MLQWVVWGLIPVLTVICIYASIRFFLRMRTDSGPTRWIWLALLSLIGGGLGWTAHYVTLTSVDPGPDLIWHVPAVITSFLIGIGCLAISVRAAEQVGQRWFLHVFALVFGTLVSTGNLMLIATARTQGEVLFDWRLAIPTVLIGYVFAFLAGNVVAHATTLRRALVGTAAAAIMSPVQDIIHLSGTRIVHDPGAPVPQGLAPDMVLLMMFVICALVVVLVGSAGLMIDRALEREATERYRKLATTDALTGLPNRTGFNDALRDWLKDVEDGHVSVIVAAIDLDKFKPINDLYGHAAGDEVLVAVADRLRSLRDAQAIFGRLGGDEFVAALLASPTADPFEEAADFAIRILDVIRQPIPHAQLEIGVDASVGLSLAPEHGTQCAVLLNAADIALYRVKSKRNGFAIYSNEMGIDNLRRARLELEIATAIRSGQFVLHFQPQVNLISGEPTGFEALIRWNHPERGLVMPGEFIPIAETSSLISEIGSWVLHDACRTAATWPAPYRVAVNVAVRQLSHPDFVDTVRSALAASGLAAGRLEIELTEASVIEDQEQALKVMHELRRLGVRIAMDDYGTGYASLATLRTFPFDKLKIDRSFISGIEEDHQLAAIVRSTLFLTKALSIPVVAEGVESRTHVDFLAREGCEDVQGYFYGRPMPAEAVEARIAAHAEAQARKRAS